MLARPGGTAKASAVLNAQFEAVETETALARTLHTHTFSKKKKKIRGLILLHGEDLGGIRPRRRTDRDSETAYKHVRKHNDGFRNPAMTRNNPNS